MAFYLRPRAGYSRHQPFSGQPGDEGEMGRGSWVSGSFRFISAAPLAMHDDCAAKNLGPVSAPWDSGREAFQALARQDFVWSPGPYSSGSVQCYYCGKAV